ncbi:hypothetical protein CCZ01_00365 [Helicobacter monodelphidis]|uniref:DUF7488 domain-containing protein n=1 Tax=Helicobacter sp. 15-1451 TaxID=2004995 RepID=UPI000DCB6EF7|nr:PDZ domain-containing protein [Helicobacter sp. 15-1451]RAX59233.1 hypothetical protein CCZ01_00365 [Helicobacter sp. 15-1451]
MIKKFIVTILVCGFLGNFLWAADFSRCAERISLSMEKVGNSYAVAINQNELLYFGKKAPNGFHIIKSDPFVGLYLLEAKKKMVPLEMKDLNEESMKGILGVGTTTNYETGKVTGRMNGFLDYAQFSAPTPQNSVITSICYQFYGLGTGDGFIESSYLKRFLDGDQFVYGAIGALFVEKDEQIIVDYVEPFIEGIKLEAGDIIIEFNKKPVTSFNEFLQSIYELTPNTEVPIKISRNGNLEDISTAVFQRTDGMLLPHHYLSALGVRFTPDWVVTAIEDTPEGAGFENLQVGDQILRLNNQEMPADFVEGAKIISVASKGPMRFLIDRNGFQFFVTTNKKKDDQWGGLLRD